MRAVADTGAECTALHQESYSLVALPDALKDQAEPLIKFGLGTAQKTYHQHHASVTRSGVWVQIQRCFQACNVALQYLQGGTLHFQSTGVYDSALGLLLLAFPGHANFRTGKSQALLYQICCCSSE